VLNRGLSASPAARQSSAAELWREVSSAVVPRSPRATMIGAGELGPPVVVGAVAKPRLKAPSEPSADTQPMTFEAVPFSSTYAPVAIPRGSSSSSRASTIPHGASAASPAEVHNARALPPVEAADPLQMNPGKTPSLVPPVLALSPEGAAAGGPRAWRIPRLRSYRALVLVTAGAAAALLVVYGTIAALRSHRASASVSLNASSAPPASAPANERAAAAASSPSLSGGAPPAASQQAAADSTAAAKTEPFAATAARHALDAQKHDVGKCRHGRVWGYASATVTFANDGSVDKVAVGPPFAGTPTGSCAAEALSTARTTPFSGAPGVVTYRFYVSR
jgi:hypothetical protein